MKTKINSRGISLIFAEIPYQVETDWWGFYVISIDFWGHGGWWWIWVFVQGAPSLFM